MTSWRADGRLHGVRVRRNFKTREEAAAEKTALELKALQAAAGLRPICTFLTEDQLRLAESVFRRLADQRYSLSVLVDYALANFRDPMRDVPLATAIAEYLAAKQKAYEQTLLSKRQLRSIKYELETFKQRFPAAVLTQFSPASLLPFLERGAASLKTYHNRRDLLSTFFKFAFRKDWIAANPVEKTPQHRFRHRRGSATTINAEQAAELMAYVETYRGGMLAPYFALCLFAGIRPCVLSGEITRLQPAKVRLDVGVIHIEPEVAKVRMKRLVTIQPNLAAWLRAYPLDRFTIVPRNAQRIRRKVFDTFGLTHDVLRHTFYFDVRREISLDGKGGPTGGQFREHYPQALPRLEKQRGSRTVFRNLAVPRRGERTENSKPGSVNFDSGLEAEEPLHTVVDRQAGAWKRHQSPPPRLTAH